MKARESFGAVAGVYHAVRPSYPGVLFDLLFESLPRSPHIIEVGAGTGLATVDLIERGATVHAVEIGPGMANELMSNLSDAVEAGSLTVTVDEFETAELPLGGADAVVAATAYHWVERTAQTDRPAQVLRPGGHLAIIDLIQVDSPDDGGFFTAAQPIYARYGQGHVGPSAPRRREVDPPIRSAVAADARFTDVRVTHHDWNQTYTAAGYRQLMTSYSVTQMMEPGVRKGLLDDMEAFVRDAFDDRVTRPLVATLTTARLI